MDAFSVPVATVEDEEWDADGFEIPSLKIIKSGTGGKEPNAAKDLKGNHHKAIRGCEKIYLGPHGAPPSQLKPHDVNPAGKKHRLNKGPESSIRKGREQNGHYPLSHG
eukprot:c24232_g1_i1 orf=333-656(-)